MNIIESFLSYFNLNIPLVPIGPLYGDKLNKFILLYIDNTYGGNITIRNKHGYNPYTFMEERQSNIYECDGKFLCKISSNKIYFGDTIKTIVSLFNIDLYNAQCLLIYWFIHKSKTMDTSHWEEIDRLLHDLNVKKMINIPTPYEMQQNLLNIIPS